MSLNRNQRLVYIHRASLFRPNAYSDYQGAYGGGDGAQVQEADTALNPTPAYANVPCRLQPASEAAQATAAGLLAEGSLFTFYDFYFDAAQEIDNTWGILLTTLHNPNNGDFFVVMDNPRAELGGVRWPINESLVFSRRSTNPFTTP